jgi:hypothetical protein
VPLERSSKEPHSEQKQREPTTFMVWIDRKFCRPGQCPLQRRQDPSVVFDITQRRLSLRLSFELYAVAYWDLHCVCACRYRRGKMLSSPRGKADEFRLFMRSRANLTKEMLNITSYSLLLLMLTAQSAFLSSHTPSGSCHPQDILHLRPCLHW